MIDSIQNKKITITEIRQKIFATFVEAHPNNTGEQSKGEHHSNKALDQGLMNTEEK